HKAYTLELGTLLQATERGHHLALQLCGWKRNARRQLFSSSSTQCSSCPHSPNRDKCLTPDVGSAKRRAAQVERPFPLLGRKRHEVGMAWARCYSPLRTPL